MHIYIYTYDNECQVLDADCQPRGYSVRVWAWKIFCFFLKLNFIFLFFGFVLFFFFLYPKFDALLQLIAVLREKRRIHVSLHKKIHVNTHAHIRMHVCITCNIMYNNVCNVYRCTFHSCIEYVTWKFRFSQFETRVLWQ